MVNNWETSKGCGKDTAKVAPTAGSKVGMMADMKDMQFCGMWGKRWENILVVLLVILMVVWWDDEKATL